MTTTTTTTNESATAAAIRQLILRDMIRLDPVHDKTDEAIEGAYHNVLCWLDGMAEKPSLESRLASAVEAMHRDLKAEADRTARKADEVAGNKNFVLAMRLSIESRVRLEVASELRCTLDVNDVPGTINADGELRVSR